MRKGSCASAAPATLYRVSHRPIVGVESSKKKKLDLTFGSKKIQFMIYKCKIKINLHQEFDHLSIVTKLCLCTFFMQLMTRRLWKKMNAETLNAHLRIHLFINFFLNDKMMIDDRIVEITYALQRVIEKSISWAKSLNQAQGFWNQNCSTVMMKLWWFQAVWKMQSTLEAWNDYLKYNNHKNKIIKETKQSHFKL